MPFCLRKKGLLREKEKIDFLLWKVPFFKVEKCPFYMKKAFFYICPPVLAALVRFTRKVPRNPCVVGRVKLRSLRTYDGSMIKRALLNVKKWYFLAEKGHCFSCCKMPFSQKQKGIFPIKEVLFSEKNAKKLKEHFSAEKATNKSICFKMSSPWKVCFRFVSRHFSSCITQWTFRL